MVDVQKLVAEYEATVVAPLRATFQSGVTKDLAWRREQLQQIIKMHEENCDRISEALRADLGGSKVRTVFDMDACGEAKRSLAQLGSWAADQRVSDPSGLAGTGLFGKSVLRHEPKGVVLMISPWNFPWGLVFRPLVAVLAAGNCAVIKPSEMSTHVSALIEELIPKYLDPAAVRVISGAVPETTALLACKWDHILYTGNGSVGRIVMAAAAKHLTPVTLELGGKSPVIIDSTAKLKLCVQRIVVSKFCVNAGQVCIAPDYVLVDRKIEEQFYKLLSEQMNESFGSTAAAARGDEEGEAKNGGGDKDTVALNSIINSRHAKRIQGLVEGAGGDVVYGSANDIDTEAKFVPPLVIRNPALDSTLMREEIFGPVLPVLAYDTLDEAIERVRVICPQPLALYVFSQSSKNTDKVLRSLTSGGVCVNSCIEHVVNPNLAFGGVGESGMGAYHGQAGFEEFSHRRSIHYRTTILPVTLLPPPVKGHFPGFIANLAFKVHVHGFMPAWVATALKTGLVVVLAATARQLFFA